MARTLRTSPLLAALLVQSTLALLRVKNALVSAWTYLGMLLWPTRLAVFYPFPDHISPALAGADLLGLLLASAALLRLRGRFAWLTAGAT